METIDEIGDFVTRREYVDDGLSIIRAMQVSRVTAMSPEMFGMVAAGESDCARIENGLLIMDFANGRWVYRIGEYNAEHRGIMLRLVEGEPIREAW